MDAVFDVAIPPYDKMKGRSCKYYAPLELARDLLYDFANSVPTGMDDDFGERVFCKYGVQNSLTLEKAESCFTGPT